MENINNNLEKLLAPILQQQNQNLPAVNGFGRIPERFMTDNGAFDLMANISASYERFDFNMDNFAVFSDLMTVTNEGLESMREHGESIRDLIEQAKEAGYTPESIAAIQDEVDYRLAEINKIRENTSFNGVNPFKTPFSLNIPDWQNFFGVNDVQKEEGEDAEEGENEITDLIASIKFDMNLGISDENEFEMGASATINIGYTEDGSLQITVDATMDFDLTGLQKTGAGSDSALELINNFLNLLTGKQNGLNTASNMFDSLFARGTASIMGDGFAIDASNDINIENETSDSIKGQIIQHAKITLDSTANQSPSIAINLL